MSTTDFTDACDYCTQPLPKIAYLRAVGFTEWETVTSPLVKAWCGLCPTDDDIDPAAAVALRAAVKTQATQDAATRRRFADRGQAMTLTTTQGKALVQLIATRRRFA